MNRKYEIMTISKISLGEAGAKKVLGTVQTHIESFEGKLGEIKPWGKRGFAYEIKHDTEGYYDVFEFEMDKKHLETLKSRLNLTDGLVRYLITALE
ncbi:MAG: 30S ribosomal protein S6 [Patescibacteria group bacterium]|jgi:small subunit ribosomal protein S6